MMKQLTPHQNAEVVDLKFIVSKECNVIISSGTDNIIRFHEDKDLMTSLVLKIIKTPFSDNELQTIQTTQFEPTFKYLIASFDRGTLRAYDIDTGRRDRKWTINEFNPESDNGYISCLMDLPDVPFFLSGDEQGMIYMWSTPPVIDKYNIFHSFLHVDHDQNNDTGCQPTCLEWNPEKYYLCVGDEHGCVAVYSYAPIL